MKGCQPVQSGPEVDIAALTIVKPTQSRSSVLDLFALAQDQGCI